MDSGLMPILPAGILKFNSTCRQRLRAHNAMQDPPVFDVDHAVRTTKSRRES